MVLTGFTDEASSVIDDQIAATEALGWNHMSLRTIGSRNIHDIDDHEFEEVCVKLEDAGIGVAEFGTLIGSWSKDITSPWSETLAEIRRCIPRMKQLNVKFARIMSYAQCPWGSDQKEEERFDRLRRITGMFKDAGLEALHENCMNWGGFSADHTLKLMEEVPGMRLIFDTGNPVFQRDRSLPPAFPWQDAFKFYKKVKEGIAHVHVKDPKMLDGEPKYCFPGEGQAQLHAIFIDLLQSDFAGFVAIEPHMGKVFHEADQFSDSQRAYEVYIEFGRRFEVFLYSLDP